MTVSLNKIEENS